MSWACAGRAASWCCTPSLLGIGMVVLNIFLVLGLSWAIARRLDLFEYIVLSAGTVLISIIGSIKAFSWFMGKTIFEYVTDQFGKFISAI